MTVYDRYKALDADAKVRRAYHLHWTPELEREGEADLEKLWDELSEEERADLTRWLREQGRI